MFLSEKIESFFSATISNRALLEQLRAEHYDVALAEIYDECIMGVFHHLGIRCKLATSAIPLFNFVGHRFGIPGIPSYVICALYILNIKKYNKKINFFMHLYNIYIANFRKKMIFYKRFYQNLL